jgi:hypothetical protein
VQGVRFGETSVKRITAENNSYLDTNTRNRRKTLKLEIQMKLNGYKLDAGEGSHPANVRLH